MTFTRNTYPHNSYKILPTVDQEVRVDCTSRYIDMKAINETKVALPLKCKICYDLL